MILRRDDTFRVVCNIRTPIGNGKENIGTGIFMTTNDNDVWIITAAHVAVDTNEYTYIAIADDNSNCTTVTLKELNINLEWEYHSIADLAIIKITVNNNNIQFLRNRALPFDHFNTTMECVSRDFELTSVGFPNGLGIEDKFSPLTYRSFASSSFLTLNRADTNTPSDFFCLENPSVGGYSGCPVFDLGFYTNGTMTITKDKTICHGITHGTMIDLTGGKIALITPAFYLLNFMNK